MEKKKEINIKTYIDSLCEVFTPDNRLLFAGIVQDCPENGTVRLVHYRNRELPRLIQENSAVKLRIRTSSSGRGQLLIYHGIVLRPYSTYWDIRLTDVLSGTENRRNFRQYIKKEAFVSSGSDLHPCIVTDISLTGIGINCREYYKIGETFTITGLNLIENRPLYEFSCTVRRSLPADAEGLYFYGCSSSIQNERTEELLYRDILKLQAEALKTSQ